MLCAQDIAVLCIQCGPAVCAGMPVTAMSASTRLSKVEEASRRFEMAKQARRDAVERRRNKDASAGLNSNPWLRRTMPTQPVPEPEPFMMVDARIGGSLRESALAEAGLTITALLPAAPAAIPRPFSPSAVSAVERPGSAQRCDKAAACTRGVPGSARATVARSTVQPDGAEKDDDAVLPEPPPRLKAQAVYRCGETHADTFWY